MTVNPARLDGDKESVRLKRRYEGNENSGNKKGPWSWTGVKVLLIKCHGFEESYNMFDQYWEWLLMDRLVGGVRP